MQSDTINEILSKFKSRTKYLDMDRRELDISRSAAAGNLGEEDYARWAMVTNDPLVMVNTVKTFITVMQSRLSSSPFRPEDNTLKELGERIRLNSIFTKIYGDVLADGYAYVSVGISNGLPVVTPVDSRYIMYTGDDPTLKDSKDIIIFTIIQKDLDDNTTYNDISIPTEYVRYDDSKERVEVAHYHIDTDGRVHLDIYDKNDKPREEYTLDGITRIPVIRFVGDEVELTDKRPHFRGIYYFVASIFKAMVLAATKIQINVALHDDDNWVTTYDSISNHIDSWRNSGVKVYDEFDINGEKTSPPIQIQSNKDFLIAAYNTWKSAVESMLGSMVLESKSEAITEQEVRARNELRDAITNSYMTKMADSISAVYTVIQGLMLHGEEPVMIVGGFLEEAKRNKEKSEMMQIYSLAKESGLNTQGFAYELLRLSDLNPDAKQRIEQTFNVSPNNNPLVVQLQQQLQQTQQSAEKQIQQQNQQIAALKVQASLRLERQASYVAMQERTKRLQIALEQWKQEQKDTQQGRLEAMKMYIAQGNNEAVLQILNSMERRDSLLMAQNAVDDMIARTDEEYVAYTNKPPIANTGLVRDPQVDVPQQIANNPPTETQDVGI